MTNRDNAVLYTGSTRNLKARIYQHKGHFVPGFTRRYNADKLVYYEVCEDALTAVARERQIKGWLRAKKIKMIEEFNSEWRDLYDTI